MRSYSVPRRSAVGQARIRLAVLLAAIATICAASAQAASAKTVWLCKPGAHPDPCTPGLSTTVYSPTLAPAARDAPEGGAPPEDRLLLRLSDGLEPDDDLANLQIDPGGALDRALPGRAVLPVLPRVRPHVPPGHRARAAVGHTTRRRRSSSCRWTTWSRLPDLPAQVQPRARLRPDRPLAGLVRTRAADRQADVDPKPALRKRLLSAILLGGNVLVKSGKQDRRELQARPGLPVGHAAALRDRLLDASTRPPPNPSLFGRTPVPGDAGAVHQPGGAQGRRGRHRSDLPVGAVRARDADRGRGSRCCT